MSVHQAGYQGLTNGELIHRAVRDGFEVLLTADRNLPAQQNIRAVGIAVVLIRGSRISEVARQQEALRSAIAGAQPGTVTLVQPG